jgi:outer membrane lipoprotein-sorting protein
MRDWKLPAFICLVLCLPFGGMAQLSESNSPAWLLSQAISRLSGLFLPDTNNPDRVFTARLRLGDTPGISRDLAGTTGEVAMRAPDHLRLTANLPGNGQLVVGRAGAEVWVYQPGKKFALRGLPDVPPFAAAPGYWSGQRFGPLSLPILPEQMALVPILSDVREVSDPSAATNGCRVVEAKPKPELVSAFRLRKFRLEIWIRTNDFTPLRIGYHDPGGAELRLEVENPGFTTNYSAGNWQLPSQPGDRVYKVARSHLTRFLNIAIVRTAGERIPSLGPPTGERRVLAREGKGRLELVDETRVLFLQGTPEEMGRQHGVLLKKEVRDLVEHILYGVGVGSSFEKGRWFMSEIEQAQERLLPFMDRRYLREMDAIADAVGMNAQEIRLANVFPELFHCSGFAVFGKATVGGKMYHGRILDYLRGMGLEQNAVVIVCKPDQGNAWVNISYAGFVGSVTAMNEKHLAIGEMGGRGEGNWDGKPMAQLVREVMERASTLDEAVAIMRRGPRTCEYYYVISDAKTGRAVGIAASPEKFETVLPGQSHPLLPQAIEDVVLMSAGDRYKELAARVKAVYGKIDARAALELMKRPVCMTSNVHAALFEPETLDFWVANADLQNPAAHTRFTRYNLRELLKPAE